MLNPAWHYTSIRVTSTRFPPFRLITLVNFDSRVIRHIFLDLRPEYFRIIRRYTCSHFMLDTFLTAKWFMYSRGLISRLRSRYATPNRWISTDIDRAIYASVILLVDSALVSSLPPTKKFPPCVETLNSTRVSSAQGGQQFPKSKSLLESISNLRHIWFDI